MTRSDGLILTIFDPFQISVQSIADSPIAKALEHAGDEWTDIPLARATVTDGFNSMLRSPQAAITARNVASG
jgi:hypothetical protein